MGYQSSYGPDDLGGKHGEDEFFFHEMCTVVDGVAVTEIFSVGPYAHDAAAAVVVMRAEKGVEAVFASVGRGIGKGCLSQLQVFFQRTVREMQFLPVPFFRPVYAVKQPGDTRNQGQRSQISEIKRRIQRR